MGQDCAHPAGPMHIKESNPRRSNEFFEIVEIQSHSNFQKQFKKYFEYDIDEINKKQKLSFSNSFKTEGVFLFSQFTPSQANLN